MAKLIEFPSQEIRKKNEFEAVLDSMNYNSEELRHCVKENVMPVLLKYSELPRHSFKLDMPSTEESFDEVKFVEKLQTEIVKCATDLQRNMIKEIIMLHVKLCESELRSK